MGFRGLISHLDKDPSLLTNVRGLLTKAHTPERFDQHFQDADFKSSTISDAIALSSSLTPGGLQHLFNSIEHLARGLLDLGYFVRCAIVKDRLFHDDKMVLGAGLVRAYLLENTVAKYPRVVVTKDVVDGLGWKNTDSIDLTFVRRSKDGLYFQHVLRFLELVKDARRFIMSHTLAIEKSPLQVYTSALVFSPACSLIRGLFQREELKWITTQKVA